MYRKRFRSFNIIFEQLFKYYIDIWAKILTEFNFAFFDIFLIKILKKR